METKIMDIKLAQNADGLYDFVMENGGIAFEYSIDTLITNLIFTNAFDGEFPVNQKEGWKGGVLTSYIWKFKHRAVTKETSLDLEDTIRNAIQPLISEGICSNINVSSTLSSGRIDILIKYFDIVGNINSKYNIAFQLSGT